VDRCGVRACPQTDRAFWAVKEVFFFCVALVYQNQPHSSTPAGFVDEIMAGIYCPAIKNDSSARGTRTG
jgi:hypothetical protein